MTTEIQRITERKPVESLSDRELIEEAVILLRSLDAALARMTAAWSAGGMRGLRTAAREHVNGQ